MQGDVIPVWEQLLCTSTAALALERTQRMQKMKAKKDKHPEGLQDYSRLWK